MSYLCPRKVCVPGEDGEGSSEGLQEDHSLEGQTKGLLMRKLDDQRHREMIGKISCGVESARQKGEA